MNKIEQHIIGIWQQMLLTSEIEANDNFFEMGGNSLLAQKTVAQLKQQYQYTVPIKVIYQNPTASAIAAFIRGKQTQPVLHFAKPSKISQQRDVAIIGIKLRFPGANTLQQFWDVLANGKETTTFFKPNELDSSLPPELVADKDYVAARGIITEAEDFDADFFGITHAMAQLMDPQHRVFLELSRNLLETTGYLPQHYKGSVGVYAGCGNNTYFLNNVLAHPDKMEAVGRFNAHTVTDKDYIASRTAFHLNLKGPAVGVFSACSTSLLAIAQATEAIRNQQCNIAVAGGVSITAPINSGHLYQEGAILSKDGHCRPFDENATGTVFSDGAGVILLKALADAEKDGDEIYGVIKGIGVNNDGGQKGSFTAPNAEGQANAIAMAINDAGISPQQISYIEAHGTATPVGDPIEFEGLNLAFGPQAQKQYCAIGSVKSNFGHLTHAAGIAGIIKTTLALKYGQIPPSINYVRPNPQINFADSPFYVNHKLSDWQAEQKIAGVSSFGVGGTNVHLILESYNAQKAQSDAKNDVQNTLNALTPALITWSAKTADSNKLYAQQLAQYVADSNSPLANIAYTLQHTRQPLPHRSFVVAQSHTQLAQQLAQNQQYYKHQQSSAVPDIALMFPGQGAQYAQMGKALYAEYPAFKTALDECATLISQQLNTDFLTLLFAEGENSQLQQTQYTQPAIFAVSYALAKLLAHLGIKASAYIGHSIGEFVGAHLAGVFSLPDAVKIITQRGRLVSQLPNGAMLSVKGTLDTLAPFITPNLSVAAVNAKQSVVLAGPTPDIEKLAETLAQNGMASKQLATSHAFHSAMMDDAIPPFTKVFDGVTLHIPQVPICSTVTAQWLKDAEATDINYWVKHLRKTVNFAEAIQSFDNAENTLFVECGPGVSLSSFAKQSGAKNTIGALKAPTAPTDELCNFLNMVGQLWLYGCTINWQNLYTQPVKTDFNLPNYAFQKQRFWLSPLPQQQALNCTSTPNLTPQISEAKATETTGAPQTENYLKKIIEILERATGIELEGANPDLNFIELGLDSLLLTQVSINLKREFNTPITFRQLNTDINTLNKLQDYLAQNSPAPQNNNTGQPAQVLQNAQTDPSISAEEKQELAKPFGATPKIEKKSTDISPQQQAFIDNFIDSYCKKTSASKQYAQQNRSHMADPRVVSGFRPATKEIVYPIVIKQSKGSKLWDLDGNEYVDALNGFGSNLLGNQPDFLVEAIKAQIDKGYEIGPQHELAGEVTQLMCDFTGFDRCALCNTGSEAVLGAMRIARTVSGKPIIVSFTGSYHGINDEVLIRGTKNLKSFPAASGIMPQAVQNMLVLEYGSDEALEIIASRSHDIACVLVEPVQSRRPEFQPVEFLQKLRKLTEEKDVILVFDEVITGFRSHLGGAQALFGVKADLATYGKVIGGGLSIGAIAGHKKYMDALDGGFWQFGDGSIPEVGVTYFAGTFVRHPLALAAAKASLLHFKAQGKNLQESLTQNTQYLAQTLNQICQRYRIPVFIAHFSSLWKVKFKEEYPFYELIFALMREKGVHILDGFPCFLTTAHSMADIDFIINTFEQCIAQLVAVNLIPTDQTPEESYFMVAENPPVNGAKIGIDENGNACWFIADDVQADKFFKIELN